MANNNNITHEGVLKLAGIEIPCFVLEDGTRVLSSRSLQEALRIREKPSEGGKRGGHILPTFLNASALKPFIDKQKDLATIEPKICSRGKQKIHGYEATTLADICDAILEARKSGAKLTSRQEIVADQCEMLIRSFAKVGIIALVDEATGYQKERSRDALQQFLDKFLLEERAKWVKTFQDEFFECIFRMKRWDWKQATSKKPQVVGHYINDWIYSRIAPDVLSELKKKNPVTPKGYRKHKHPQYIDTDFGHPKLKEHISSVIALIKASGYNENTFKRLIERAFPRFDKTIKLDLPESED